MSESSIAVIGAGAFGTALAAVIALTGRHKVTLVGRDPQLMADLRPSICMMPCCRAFRCRIALNFRRRPMRSPMPASCSLPCRRRRRPMRRGNTNLIWPRMPLSLPAPRASRRRRAIFDRHAGAGAAGACGRGAVGSGLCRRYRQRAADRDGRGGREWRDRRAAGAGDLGADLPALSSNDRIGVQLGGALEERAGDCLRHRRGRRDRRFGACGADCPRAGRDVALRGRQGRAGGYRAGAVRARRSRVDSHQPSIAQPALRHRARARRKP
jgi:hypothetical protein